MTIKSPIIVVTADDDYLFCSDSSRGLSRQNHLAFTIATTGAGLGCFAPKIGLAFVIDKNCWGDCSFSLSFVDSISRETLLMRLLLRSTNYFAGANFL